MGLEVYYPQDIRNALLAAEQANAKALCAAGGEDNEFARGYKEGYGAALVTLALAFGLIQPFELTENCQLEQGSYLPPWWEPIRTSSPVRRQSSQRILTEDR